MKVMKIGVIAAIAGAILALTDVSASARTIGLFVLPLNTTSTFTIGVNTKSPFLDDLTFSTPTAVILLISSVTDDEHPPFQSMLLGDDATDTGLDMELFSGTPTGIHSLLETDFTDSGNTQTQDLSPIVLAPGSYYFQVTDTAKGRGNKLVGAYAGNGKAYGEYTLDATVTSVVPEPASWIMMMLGFGLLGFRLRKIGAGRTITGSNAG